MISSEGLVRMIHLNVFTCLQKQNESFTCKDNTFLSNPIIKQQKSIPLLISLAKVLLIILTAKNQPSIRCKNLLRNGGLFVNKPKHMVYAF